MSAKRDTNSFQSIGDAIRELLNSYQLESKFDETKVVTSWDRLVGKPIARRTKKVSIRNKVLFVEFDSPAMKQDFMMHKNEILSLFNKEFGTEVIKDIVVL